MQELSRTRTEQKIVIWYCICICTREPNTIIYRCCTIQLHLQIGDIYFLVMEKGWIRWASGSKKREILFVVDQVLLFLMPIDLLLEMPCACNSICSAARIYSHKPQGQWWVVLDSITTLYDSRRTCLHIAPKNMDLQAAANDDAGIFSVQETSRYMYTYNIYVLPLAIYYTYTISPLWD